MIATTRGALLRGSSTDDLGDEIDDDGDETGHFETIPATYTAWAESRRNQASNTLKGDTLARLAGIRGTVSLGAGFVRLTVTDALTVGGAQRIAFEGGNRIPIAPGQTLFRFDVEGRTSSSSSFSITAQFYDAGGINILVAPPGAPVSGSSFTPFFVEAAVPAGAVTASIQIGLWVGARAIGDTFDVRFATSAGLPWFDGSSAGGELVRYSYLGTPGDSPSIEETRAIDVPAHDVWVVDRPSAIVAGFDDFPVSLIEKSRNEFDEASNTWRSVRYFAGRVSSRIPVKAGDRIRDNRDRSLYVVGEVESMARGLSGRSSVTLTLKRTAP